MDWKSMQKRESKVKNKQPQRKKRNSSLEKQAPQSYIILREKLIAGTKSLWKLHRQGCKRDKSQRCHRPASEPSVTVKILTLH